MSKKEQENKEQMFIEIKKNIKEYPNIIEQIHRHILCMRDFTDEKKLGRKLDVCETEIAEELKKLFNKLKIDN